MQIYQVKKKMPLMEFLLDAVHGVKKATLKQHLKFRAVFVNGKPITQFDFELYPGDQVWIERDKEKAEVDRLRSTLQILHEDDALIVISKPSGLLTVATEKERTRTAFYQVYEYLKTARDLNTGHSPRSRTKPAHTERPLYIVHRLDQEASGVLVLAKTLPAKLFLQENWHEFEKRYYAIVEGTPREESGKIESYLKENEILRVFSSPTEIRGSKYALTHYRVLASEERRSLLEITLKTGRKHQIRVHLALIGHPILGDKDYGNKTLAKRLALHAFSLSLTHPVTRKWLTFKSDLPGDLRKLIPANMEKK